MSSETSNVVIPAASPGGAETVAQTQTQTQTQEVPATTAAGDSMEGIETGDAPASTENTSGGNTQQAGETERYRWPTLEMELEEKRLTYIE